MDFGCAPRRQKSTRVKVWQIKKIRVGSMRRRGSGECHRGSVRSPAMLGLRRREKCRSGNFCDSGFLPRSAQSVVRGALVVQKRCGDLMMGRICAVGPRPPCVPRLPEQLGGFHATVTLYILDCEIRLANLTSSNEQGVARGSISRPNTQFPSRLRPINDNRPP